MSPDALELELERLHAAAFGWALACCAGDRAAAEDALQASYLKILDRSARFDGRATFRTWLFGVVRRTAAEQRRRTALRRLLPLAVLDAAPDGRPDAAAALARTEGARRLEAALATLSPGPHDRRGGGSGGRLHRHRPHPLRARQGGAATAARGGAAMSERDDHDLRDRFQRLRREDMAGVTPFQATLAAAAARRAASPRPPALRLAAAAAVIAALAVAVVLATRGRHGMAIDLARAPWEVPSDFLLQVPGAELLRTVPELGRVTLPFHYVDTDWRTP